MHRTVLLVIVLFLVWGGLVFGPSYQIASSQQQAQTLHLSQPGTVEITSDLPLMTTMDGLTNRVVIEAMATATAEPTPELTPEPTPEPEPGYYVDCANGDDANDGTTPGTAWQTVKRANSAELVPGEILRFLRGCVFHEQLTLDWDGVTITAYGEGDNPAFRKNNGPSIQVTGNNQTISHLTAFHEVGDYPGTDTRGDCSIPQGWRVGIVVNGDDNVLSNITATQNSVGVFFQDSSERNVLTESRLVDNEYDPNSSIGPTGVLLHGTGNEISHSYFTGNQGACSPPGTAFEIYKAYDSWIHHNTVLGDRKFAEMGVSDNTLIEHNRMYNFFELGGNGSQGIVTRGEGAAFGPVYRTTVRYNTFVFANPAESDKAAILNCSACSPDILTAHHNIFVSATKRIAWVGGSINEHDNVYWNPDTQAAPRIDGYTPTNPVYADPLLVDPANGDFRLQDGSPTAGYGAE